MHRGRDCRSVQRLGHRRRDFGAAPARWRSSRDMSGAIAVMRRTRRGAIAPRSRVASRARAMERAAAAEHAPLAHIGERHRAQIEMDLVAELFPQIVGEAAALVAGAAGRRARRAARGADRLVDREDDVGDARPVGAVRQEIAAARAAHALDQPADAQLGEELLEIGERDLLALGDLGQARRACRRHAWRDRPSPSPHSVPWC